MFVDDLMRLTIPNTEGVEAGSNHGKVGRLEADMQSCVDSPLDDRCEEVLRVGRCVLDDLTTMVVLVL